LKNGERIAGSGINKIQQFRDMMVSMAGSQISAGPNAYGNNQSVKYAKEIHQNISGQSANSIPSQI
jgi:hypothetical protein